MGSASEAFRAVVRIGLISVRPLSSFAAALVGLTALHVVGDLFFKSVFAVFDLENTRVGLAQRQSDLAGRVSSPHLSAGACPKLI